MSERALYWLRNLLLLAVTMLAANLIAPIYEGTWGYGVGWAAGLFLTACWVIGIGWLAAAAVRVWRQGKTPSGTRSE